MKMRVTILRDRPTIKLKLTRDSVCAADDCNVPHDKIVTIPSFTQPKIFIPHLASSYLPLVSGAGYSWDCFLNGELVGTLTHTGVKAKLFYETKYEVENHVHFRYNSSRR